jgi:ribosome recycling factor
MANMTEFKQQLERVINMTRENMSSIRTGRASASLVENIQVSTYGGQATLRIMELATITTNGPSELLIVPFDPSVTQDIEKKLRESSMGFLVSVDSNTIRAKTPALSEEQRQKYVKLINEYAEDSREKLRQARDDIRKKVKAEFEAKEISEDIKFRTEAEIDKVTKEYTTKVDEIRKKKEDEVMTV